MAESTSKLQHLLLRAGLGVAGSLLALWMQSATSREAAELRRELQLRAERARGEAILEE